MSWYLDSKSASEGLLFCLREYRRWSWFATLTFKGRVPGERKRMNMYYHWLRLVEKSMGLPKSNRSHWALRSEFGELEGRAHFHALLRVPEGENNPGRRFEAMAIWEKIGGGMARIRAWHDDDSKGDALGYVFKGGKNHGANLYEMNKFALQECDCVRISPGLEKALLAGEHWK